MSTRKHNQSKVRVDLSSLLAATSGGALLLGSFLGIGGAALGSVVGAGFSIWAKHLNDTARHQHTNHEKELQKEVAH